jgi:DNA repair ATPase RecN
MTVIWRIAKNIVLLVLPLFLGGTATYFEITSGNLTQRELILINALQFVSSIWFGWASSQIVSEQNFQERQKRFALSAYRRIKEIEYSVERLLSRIRVKSASGNPATIELDAIREMVLSLRATARSSKADWADVIGEEIRTLEEIEEIEESENDAALGESASDLSSQALPRAKTVKLQRLRASLPKSLEIQAQQLNPRDRLEDAINLFQEELQRKGYIELEGFWDSSFGPGR